MGLHTFAFRGSIFAFSLVIFSALWGGAQAETASTLRIPVSSLSGPSVLLAQGGGWRWEDSCRSIARPCAQGVFAQSGGKEAGLAFLSAGITSEAEASIPLRRYCQQVLGKQGVVKKNHCFASGAHERTFFWRQGRTLVSISFSPVEGVTGVEAERFYSAADQWASSLKIEESAKEKK